MVRMTVLQAAPSRIFLALSAAVGLTACPEKDSRSIPYSIKALDVYVYNDDTDTEFFAGRVETDYSSIDEGLSNCSADAYALARDKHLQNWSYICCTITNDSSCVTKVR